MANESGILVLVTGTNGQLSSLSTESLGAARRITEGLGGNATVPAMAGTYR